MRDRVPAVALGWKRPAVGIRLDWHVPVSFAVGAVVYLSLRAIGAIAGTADTLVAMGFDPDRARLIAALVAGGLAGGAASVAAGHRLSAGVASVGVFGAFYLPTFRDETSAALASRGADGIFDPLGWAFTVLTLGAVGFVVAWAAATLGQDARRGLLSALRAFQDAAGRRSLRGVALWKPILAVTILAVLAVTGPAFGDMVNYTPDLMMRHGAPVPIPLVAAQTAPSTSPSPLPSALVPDPSTGTLGTVGSIATGRPWLIHAPIGAGKIQTISLPAPWTGGRTSTASVWVYLPPGYGANSLRYTTLYEVPWSLAYWNGGSNIVTQLDALITSGQIPPTIVVFVSADGGPFVDSECANSADGREQFDSYVADTVVPYIDAHFHTLSQAAARTLIGFSEGGYCSATLLLHHPDVFGNAVAMSGYYTAAPRDPQTINSWRPFDNNQALIKADSPLLIAPTLPAAQRKSLFVILTGSLTERFYGPNLQQFASELTKGGYGVVVLPTQLGHAWKGVRSMLQTVLNDVAGHQLAAGVYKGIYS